MTTVGKLDLNMIKFTWTLENFSKLCSNVNEQISSPLFQTNSFNGFKWKLNLFLFRTDDNSQDFISLHLYNQSYNTIDVSFKIILSNMNDITIIQKKAYHKFSSHDGYGWPRFIERDSIALKKDSLPNDILNITCIIHMDTNSQEELVDINKKILDDYKLLFFEEGFSDITIIINDKHIKAHKNILSARSTVFAAMFSHDMMENNTNIMEITDVNYDVMKELLLFIYSGEVNNLELKAIALLPAAEKYAVEELKVLCEKSILKNITTENACEILIVADLYYCPTLKAETVDYIINNIKQLINKSEFKSLNRSNPELFEEIMFAIVEKKL